MARRHLTPRAAAGVGEHTGAGSGWFPCEAKGAQPGFRYPPWPKALTPGRQHKPWPQAVCPCQPPRPCLQIRDGNRLPQSERVGCDGPGQGSPLLCSLCPGVAADPHPRRGTEGPSTSLALYGTMAPKARVIPSISTSEAQLPTALLGSGSQTTQLAKPSGLLSFLCASLDCL